MGEREREGNPSKWVSGSRGRETKDEGRGCLLRTPSVERGKFLLGFPFIINDNFPGSSGYFPELVAVTVSHPPGQAYDEKASSTPTKHAEPPREEIFGDVRVNSNGILRRGIVHCARKKFIETSLQCCAQYCCSVFYCSSLCQKQGNCLWTW
ncbi:hypothetical protein NC652_010241 [Populus alba x Populus x berolinensis]|nr:hypothetical protein NC652_010241 [Populus alba x Populus x berolinensis]